MTLVFLPFGPWPSLAHCCWFLCFLFILKLILKNKKNLGSTHFRKCWVKRMERGLFACRLLGVFKRQGNSDGSVFQVGLNTELFFSLGGDHLLGLAIREALCNTMNVCRFCLSSFHPFPTSLLHAGYSLQSKTFSIQCGRTHPLASICNTSFGDVTQSCPQGRG